MALLGRDTSVSGPFPKGVLLLETLEGREALGVPYVFQLGLLCRNSSIDPDEVLGQPLAVGIKLGSGEERFFHGIVTEFSKTGSTRLHTRYSATLSPLLSEFDYTFDCRVFNDAAQDALSIATAVLAERGLTDVESGSIEDHVYRAREYCVQYRESDLHFVQRLLEEEGIYYFFRHEEAKHTLVLADSIIGHETVEGYATVLYAPKERRVAGAEEHLWGMQVRKALYPGRHTVLAGYDPAENRPKQLQIGDAASDEAAPGSEFEHYDYPGGLFDPEEARQEASLRAQASCVENTVIEVEGSTMGLGVGDLVTLRPSLEGGEAIFPFWDEEDFTKQHLIVGASYKFSIDQHETGEVAKSDEPYRAKYQLLDSHTQFRPKRRTSKPRMGGPQTALVVGPAGEEIWTDNLGRVRVQFDWDRLGGRNEKSTCWVRVAQMWADGRWGAMHLPRIGQEVIVRFLDGDPDRPIVSGSLYSADNMPPYELPGNQTQSGIKSRSSKGGAASNFNEIRFEDGKGAEELHVQAEKDMSTLVKHCQTLHVGVNRSIVVGNNEDIVVGVNEDDLVKGNRDLTVNVNDSEVIGGDHDKTVTGTVFQIYGGDHSRKVDGEQELVEEKNKDEHVKQAYTLTTDKKFQLVQDATSMTFRRTNVTLDSAGEIVVMAGGATVSVEKTGMTTFMSPTGITLLCGASSLAILPGGIAVASPAVTAAAGGGSVLAMGSEAVALNSKKVTIEAEGVCSIKGKSKLKLQEADAVKAKKSGGGSGVGEGEAAASAKEKRGKRVQKGAVADSPTLEIHVVDLDGKPQEGLKFQIKKPDGGAESGKLDKDGRGVAKSSKPGGFTVAFPDLDGGDWDGDGAPELPPPGSRSEAGKVTATSEDRVPAIARDQGFLNWRTVWDFPGNAALKNLRENPNVLWKGDKIAIPSRVKRMAEVVGGAAEYVVNCGEDRWVSIRLLDFDLEPFAGLRYRANVGDPTINRGVVPDDGYIVLDAPADEDSVLILLFAPDDGSEPLFQWKCQIREDPLGDSARDKAQRLVNLGFGDSLPEGDEPSENDRRALLHYRSHAENHEDDDAAVLDDLVAVHDDEDGSDDGGGRPA